MCESAAYLLTERGEELVLEAVDTLQEQGGVIEIVNIFGERRKILGSVRTFSLVEHKILFEGRLLS